MRPVVSRISSSHEQLVFKVEKERVIYVYLLFSPFLKCMIDITIYQQRLEWLREWIEYRLDKNFIPAKTMEFYDLTGHLIWTSMNPHPYHSFEIFCEQKHYTTINH